MGFARDHNMLKINQDIARMDLIYDEQSYVYFHDVLYKCLRKIFNASANHRSEKIKEKLMIKIVRK